MIIMIEPNFEIDKYGLTVCKSHSNYPNLTTPELIGVGDYQIDFTFAKVYPNLYAWCPTCNYYKSNNCYFTSSRIDDIRKRHGIGFGLFFNRYKCDICGGQVRNYFNTMRQIYIKEVEGGSIPLLCSGCNFDLRNDKLAKRIRMFTFLNLLYLSIIIASPIILLIVTFMTSNDIALFFFMFAVAGIFVIFIIIFLRKTWHLLTYKKILTKYPKSLLIK